MSNPLAPESVDVVYRGQFDKGLELRAGDSAAGSTMVGHFSMFNNWYEINSAYEGHFLERCVPGCYARTISNNRSSIKVAFDHGYDPQIGDKPLGPIETLSEDEIGAYYEVPLLDTDYNRDFVLPALEGRTMDGRKLGSVLGASFRFRVVGDAWDMEPERSDHNPDGIPERSITEARVFEFGPVVYPANPEATSGVRSLTDDYMARSLARSGRSAHVRELLAQIDGVPPGETTGTPDETTGPLRHSVAPVTTVSSIKLATSSTHFQPRS